MIRTRGHVDVLLGGLPKKLPGLSIAFEGGAEPVEPGLVDAPGEPGELAPVPVDQLPGAGFEEVRVGVGGDLTSVAHALNALGDAESIPGSGGSLDRAATYYNDALDLFRTEDDQRGIAVALTNLGNLAWDRDELDRATGLHGEALGRYREIGDGRGVAWSLNNLGLLDRERGELAGAFRLLNEALGLYVAIGDRNGIAEALEGLGSVVDLTTEAARLLGAAETLRQVLGTPLSLAKRATNLLIVDSIRAVTGEDAFTTAWEAGQGASIEDAVATALAMTDESIQSR